jgi:hypothetical protein
MLERWLVDVWETLVAFLNSNFGTAFISALIGSFAGAWGGAYAAQRIADRSRRRSLWLDEVRGCNAGIDAVGSTLNAFLNLKGQHLVDLKRNFDEQLGAIEVQRRGRQEGWIDPNQRLDLRIDQGSLPIMHMPLERLQSVMTEKVTLSGRPQGLMNMVVQSVHLCNEMISERNKLIVVIMALPREQQVPRLFGLPLAGVGQDNRHRDCIEGVWKYSNDVIYYSSELSRALTKHGRKVEALFRRDFGGLRLRTTEMLFDTAEWRELAPDLNDYASWEGTYVEMVPRTEGRSISKIWCGVRRAARRLLLLPWGRWKKRSKYLATIHADHIHTP